MIKLTNFYYGFPDKDLYDNVSFNIEKGDSVAFIGSSGSGKSTLASILLNPYNYMYDGELEIDENCKMGYVSQFYDVDKTKQMSVFDYIAQEFVSLQAKIDDICAQMETAEEYETLLEQYQEALDQFEAIDGDNYINNINKKLGLANLANQRDLDVTKISGGEFKLIQVIKQMLTHPTFIIMDEPDAFLDFENLNSLKNLINSHKGTMLTITHSRYLLNHCFNKILHLENKEIQQYDGRYIDYNFKLLVGKIEMQEQAYKDDQEIARNEELIEKHRFIATNYDSPANGRALNARVKYQERLIARRAVNPFINIAKPKIDFKTENVVEDENVVEVNNLQLSFDDVLLDNVTFEIGATDKVAIIGENGVGKTTLMNAIYNHTSDSIKFSENTKVAYLSQNHDDVFKEDQTIYDEFFDIGFKTYDEISSYLADFGFPLSKMDKKVSTLSGGEKNILGLAKLSKGDANLLILDEPTSHLDTYAQIALEEAISRFNGAILMISHDFYPIVNCMDYLLILENKTARKMQMKKFKRMIYLKHFGKDYLEIEQNKKNLETRIEFALSNNNFEQAKVIATELEELIKLL